MPVGYKCSPVRTVLAYKLMFMMKKNLPACTECRLAPPRQVTGSESCWNCPAWRQRVHSLSLHNLSPAEKINQMCRSTSPSHCKLSPPAAAEDGRLDASDRTSLTARIRVSMLSKVALSRGWEVNQWELSRSRNEY